MTADFAQDSQADPEYGVAPVMFLGVFNPIPCYRLRQRHHLEAWLCFLISSLLSGIFGSFLERLACWTHASLDQTLVAQVFWRVSLESKQECTNRRQTSGQVQSYQVAQALHSFRAPVKCSDRMCQVSLFFALEAVFLPEASSSHSWRSVLTQKAFSMCSSRVSQAMLYFSQLRVSHPLLAR